MSITRDYRRFLGGGAPPPPDNKTSGGQLMSIAWVAAPGTAVAWTNMPGALTEVYGTTIRQFTIELSPPSSGIVQFDMGANQTVSGSAAATLGLQYYRISESGTWRGMDNGLSGVISTAQMSVNTASAAPGTPKLIGWTNVASGAQASIRVRIVGQSGDGVADPSWTNGNIFFRRA